MSFKIAGRDPQSAFLTRMVVLCCGVALLAGLVAYLRGSASGSKLTSSGVFVAISVMVVVYGYPWTRAGTARLDSTGFRVKRGIGVEVYRWEDLEEVRAGRFGDRGGFSARVAFLAGRAASEEAVVLRARYPIKFGLPGRSGTAVAGISVGARTVYLYTERPDEFVREARKFMNTQDS